MARTTITVGEGLLAQAAALGINVSEAAREGVRAAVEARTISAQLDAVFEQAADDPIPVDGNDLAVALREIRESGEPL